MKPLLLISLIVISSNLFAQDKAERINFAHHYNLEEAVRMEYYSGIDDSGEFSVIIGVESNDVWAESDYVFSFRNVESYDASLDVAEMLPAKNQMLGKRENRAVYKFSFYGLSSPLLICELRNNTTGLTYFIDVEVTERKLHGMLIDSFGMPTTSGYVNEGRYRVDQPVEFDVYSYDFPAARPPMSTSPPDVPRTMELSTSFSMDSTYDHIFDEAGLYVGRDLDQKISMVYRTQGSYFPEYVTLPDLVDPLIYITTKEEREKLRANIEDKKVFDRFWLDLTGSKERARWIIRNYYKRITEANTLFTTFKEGWKTDRGMMYIIFGAPDEVIRNGKEELWYYKEGLEGEKLIFTFNMIRSPYAERQYVLNRDRSLSDPWMSAVKFWRQGMPIRDM